MFYGRAVIEEGANGLFTIALRPCTVAILATFLPQEGLVAWLRTHCPDTRIQWTEQTLPLRVGGEPIHVRARGVVFDVQLPVAHLVRLLPELEDSGLDLYLMARAVPDTLTLEGLPADVATRVLRQNGLVAHFDLPHAHETAVLSAPLRETLEHWLAGPLQQWVQ